MQNNYHSIIAGTVPIPTAVSWTWSPSRSQYVYKVRVAHGNRKDGNTAVTPANLGKVHSDTAGMGTTFMILLWGWEQFLQ